MYTEVARGLAAHEQNLNQIKCFFLSVERKRLFL